MATMIIFHEVEDGERWAKAWRKGPGSRHEMLAKGGVTAARVFQDPGNPNSTGLLWEVSDMEKLQEFMETDEAKQSDANYRATDSSSGRSTHSGARDPHAGPGRPIRQGRSGCPRIPGHRAVGDGVGTIRPILTRVRCETRQR